MRCLVTAGPTIEPLDAVRQLTNFSTGRLGTLLAVHLARAGQDVTLLLSERALVQPESLPSLLVVRFATGADLGAQLRAAAAASPDAVFHAAAVSDFTCGPVWERDASGRLREVRAGKLSSREGPLLVELRPATKLIAGLRCWFPRARLVGWKYEVDGDPTTAVAAATRQLAECQTNVCVVNGPAYGAGYGVVTSAAPVQHCEDEAALFAVLLALVSGSAPPA